MQSGVVSNDNIAEILREISQRRRQGVLEMHVNEEAMSIYFVQGKIVEVALSTMTPVQETVEWLQRAGIPVQAPETYIEPNYAQLLQRLKEDLPAEKSVHEDLLRHVIRERMLERLYTLEFGGGAFYNFKVQMVEFERDFAPLISVGQLLLDIVELQSEAENFAVAFPPECIIRPVGKASAELSPEESWVFQALEKGCSVLELRDRALLSKLSLQRTLLLLKSYSLVSVSDDLTDSVTPDLKDFVSSSIDEAFGMMDLPDDDGSSSVPESATQGLPKPTQAAACNGRGVGTVEEELLRYNQFQQSIAPLQSVVIPRLMAIGFIIVALAVPLLTWSHIITKFGE